MPQIVKQRPPVRSNGRPASASVLDLAIPVEELDEAPFKLLIYGANRSGKTTLACGFPKPLLLLTFDAHPTGGAESVRSKDFHGVHVLSVVPDNSKLLEMNSRINRIKINQAIEIAVTAHTRFKTVVLDGATSIQDVFLANIMQVPAVPEQNSWGMVQGDAYRERSEQCKELMRKFLDSPANTLILAQEKDHNPPKEEKVNERTGKVSPDMRPKFLRGLQHESFVTADVGGATAGWLHNNCDIVRLFVEEEEIEKVITQGEGPKKREVRMLRKTGKYIRYLRVAYHPNFAAGLRSNRPVKDEVIANPTAEKLMAIIRGTDQ